MGSRLWPMVALPIAMVLKSLLLIAGDLDNVQQNQEDGGRSNSLLQTVTAGLLSPLSLGIPPEEAFNPTAASRGLRLPRNDTISAKQAWAWLMRNVDLNPALAVQPPPTAPAASRGVYVNWIDLYDAKEFRWHQWWCARVPVLCRIARPLFRVLQSPCERARATPSAESRGHSRAPPG